MARNQQREIGRLPAYLSYSSWLKLLEGLEKYLPPRFDGSYWDGLKFSGTTRFTARSTFIFLGLMDSNGKPTDKLQQLVDSTGDERRIQLKGIIEQAYRPVIGDLDLDRATAGQLEELFRSAGAKGNVGEKSISFFLALAKDAGIALSPPLEAKTRGRRMPRTTVTRARHKRRKDEKTEEQQQPPSGLVGGISWTGLLEELLLEEFPGFDASWSDDTKIKWLFRELKKKARSD